MKDRKSWTKAITTELKDSIKTTSLAAYKNACELLKDAKILLREGRSARAGALAILSEEEFSKAFSLVICIDQNRWDSGIFYGLKKHPEKQGISEAMKEYLDWFMDNYDRVTKMNRLSFVPVTPASIPGPKQLAEWLDKAKKGVKKAKTEQYKQSLLYVDFDINARVTSEPCSISQEEAENRIKEAEKYKKVVEITLMSQIVGFKEIEI